MILQTPLDIIILDMHVYMSISANKNDPKFTSNDGYCIVCVV